MTTLQKNTMLANANANSTDTPATGAHAPDAPQAKPAVPVKTQVPAAFFGMVVGLLSLAQAWRMAETHWGLTGAVYVANGLWVAGGLLWVVLMASWLPGWVRQSPSARAERMHPIQGCLVGLAPVSTMLLAVASKAQLPMMAAVLAWVGAAAALAFFVWRVGMMWQGGRELSTVTPALYIPGVANMLVLSILLSAFGWRDWAQLPLGAGTLIWLALESLVWWRLLSAPPMPVPLRPLLGIQLAPPVVVLVAAWSAYGPALGLMGPLLWGHGLLALLVLLRLAPWLLQGGFTPGLWGASFGLGALAQGAFMLSPSFSPAAALAAPVFAFVNVAVAVLVWMSARRWFQGKLIPPALPLPTAGQA